MTNVVTMREEAITVAQQLRINGATIVLTSGSFDLFHAGHLNYLDKAATFGDHLIVGVDSDAKIRQRKGPQRPVMGLVERTRMVARHPSVAVVVVKNEAWPRWALITDTRPDVLVASEGTYTQKDVAALADYCGQVVVVPRQDRMSTSARVNLLPDYGGLFVVGRGEDQRISLDEMFLNMALIVAQRATCARLQVGAVIARHGRTISTGYNGAPSGEKHCECTRSDSDQCPVSVHAELNAVVFAARNGVSVECADMYLTHNPCHQCCAHLINAGITRVCFSQFRRNSSGRGVNRLRIAGVQVVHRQLIPTEGRS